MSINKPGARPEVPSTATSPNPSAPRAGDAPAGAPPSGAARLALCSLGLGCWLATLLIYSNTLTPFQRFAGTQLFVGDFAPLSLAIVALLSLAVAVSAWRGRSLPRAVLDMGGTAAHLVACASFALVAAMGDTWPGGLPAWVAPALSMLVALGCVLCGLAWGRVFQALSARQSLLCVVCAAGVCAALGAMGLLVPQGLYPWVFCLEALVAAVLPLPLGATQADDADTAGPAAPESLPLQERLSSFADVAAPALAGLMAAAFVMGTMRALIVDSYLIHLGALALCAALLAAVVLRHRARPVTQATCRGLIPALAILLLAAANVTSALWGGSPFDMFMVFLLYTLAALLTLSTLSAVAHAREFPCDLLFSTALALFGAASSAGLLCSQVMDARAIKVCMTLVTTLYAFATVVTTGFRSPRKDDESYKAFVDLDGIHDWLQPQTVRQSLGAGSGPACRPEGTRRRRTTPLSAPPTAVAGAHGAIPLYPHAEQTCSHLAERFHLTPRESEILRLLARGQDSAAISEALFISQNTVRSHIHNLCRKTGAASRAQLVEMASRTGREAHS